MKNLITLLALLFTYLSFGQTKVYSDSLITEIDKNDTIYRLAAKQIIGASKADLTESGTDVTLNLSKASFGVEWNAVELTNASTVTVTVDTAGVKGYHYWDVLINTDAEILFNTPDLNDETKRLPSGNSGSMVLVAMVGDEIRYRSPLLVDYVASAITASAPLYDFNAQNESVTTELVSLTNDGSGVVTSATQATASNRADVVDDGGGKLAYSFDGDDSYTLVTPSDINPTMGTSDFTVIIVRGASAGSGGTTTIFGDRDATDYSFNIGQTASDNLIYQMGASGQAFDTGLSTSARVISEVSVEGALYDTYIDGSADTVDQATGTDATQNEVVIGGRSSGTNYYTGTIRRILYWNRILTAQERTDISAELQTVN